MALMMLAEEGLIDVILGGPPCSTWSKLRFLPGGLLLSDVVESSCGASLG